jgi:hypothetical protein
MQFTMFRGSKNCDMHFMTSDWWKDTSFFNTIMNALTRHTSYWRKSKTLAGKCSPSSLRLNFPFQTTTVWVLKRWHMGPALWHQWDKSSKLCIHGCKILKWATTTGAYLSSCCTHRNAWIILGISWKSDRTTPVTHLFLYMHICFNIKYVWWWFLIQPMYILLRVISGSWVLFPSPWMCCL